MPRFSLSLLGAFQAVLDGEPVTRFGSAKTQALLAYLAVESDRPHRRDSLAGLLWPDEPDRKARNNLRHALSMLRGAIGDRDLTRENGSPRPVLLVSRETVQLNCTSDCWVDVSAFQDLVETEDHPKSAVDGLERAVALYRGDFLEGFYVSESAAFDDWAMLVRDRLQRQASAVLRRLIEAHSVRGQHREARVYAWRWVALEPWQESAHRQLMTVLALSGQRTEALAQFEACRDMLQAEYDVEPSRRTRELWERIRDGSLAPAEAPLRTASEPSVLFDLPYFVAREQELAALEGHLAAALGGDGRVVFIAGEAGHGKTALAQAFSHQAQRRYPRLLVASGNCNAYTGLGDPYLPFREILELLTGEVDARAASLSRDHVRRLRGALPLIVRALTDHGPDLLDVFVPGEPLLRRARTYAEIDGRWVGALGEAVARQAAGRQSGVQQEDLFEQVTKVLTAVARQAPLLLVIDDLQWADLGTIGLLFHLGRRLAGSPILILGAYRSEEVGAGRDSARHPLEPVINEFRRTWGDILIDLHEAESRWFVEALLDSEPNDLGEDFRKTLYRQTGGHALFTVELLRGMQERGDLIKDEEGRWVAGSRLDWSILPARIEAVIAERVARLAEPLCAVLQAASVEGEVFTAEAVARTQDQAVRDVIDGLSGDLDRKHHLVCGVGIQRVDGQRLSQYRFRHILFQTYLYNTLDEIERAHLHERIGEALEELYQASEEAIATAAPQLAHQFEQAGMADRAVHYYELAGQRAIRMLAYQEAVGHLTRALELLGELPASSERDARELRLRLAVAAPLFVLKSWGADELVEHYSRAEILAERLGEISRQLQLLRLALAYHTSRAEHQQAMALAKRYYALAQRLEDPRYLMVGHEVLVFRHMFLGEFGQCKQHLEAALALYDRSLHSGFRFEHGQDPKVASLVFGLYALWCLGYPDQALQAAREAVALAEDLRHPLSICLALAFEARLHRWRDELQAVEALIPQQRQVAAEYALRLSAVFALQDQGWVSSQQGDPETGIALYNEALAFWDATGMGSHLTEFYAVLAEMHGKAGQPEQGLQVMSKAMALIERTDERYHEAELYRLRGELRLQQDRGNVEEAAADFRRAIAVAQRQKARSLELRAAMSLYRLWRDQGAAAELIDARARLSQVYDWFTEGFNTRDLVEARALLDS